LRGVVLVARSTTPRAALIDEHADELAAVTVEPPQRALVPRPIPSRRRDVTRRHDRVDSMRW
jgi:hypothetical protein